MARHKTTDEAVIERLRGEINAKRRQVQDALECSIEAGHWEPSRTGRLYQVFASFQGDTRRDRLDV